MEYLQFIFSGFWTFVGVALLLAILLDGTAGIIRAIRGR